MVNNNQNNDHSKESASIKITSFNVRGMRNETKRARVLRHMRDNYPGILFLQETYSMQGDEKLETNMER